MPEKAVTSGLVDRPQDAVRHTRGPLLIRAGASTDKTTTTAKIAYMVQELGIASGATGWWGRSSQCRWAVISSRFIDRVDLTPGTENEVEIIDYKTEGEPGSGERSRQLLLYAHGFKHLYPEYTVRIRGWHRWMLVCCLRWWIWWSAGTAGIGCTVGECARGIFPDVQPQGADTRLKSTTMLKQCRYSTTL